MISRLAVYNNGTPTRFAFFEHESTLLLHFSEPYGLGSRLFLRLYPPLFLFELVFFFDYSHSFLDLPRASIRGELERGRRNRAIMHICIKMKIRFINNLHEILYLLHFHLIVCYGMMNPLLDLFTIVNYTWKQGIRNTFLFLIPKFILKNISVTFFSHAR